MSRIGGRFNWTATTRTRTSFTRISCSRRDGRWHLVYLGRYDEAVTQLVKTLETEPNYPAAHLGLWGAFYKKGSYGDALREARTFFRLLGDERLSDILPLDGNEAGYASAMQRAAETLAARRASACACAANRPLVRARRGEGAGPASAGARM